MSEQTTAAAPQFTSEDRQADWVNMTLGWGKRRKKSSDLILSLSVSEHYIPTPIGTVHFGLKAGELRLTLTNAGIPHERREPRGDLPIKITVTRKLAQATDLKQSTGTEVTVSGGVRRGKRELGTSGTSKKLRERSDLASAEAAFTEEEWLVHAKGSPTRPRWKFKAVPGRRVLEGGYHRLKLGRVYPVGQPANVEARFTARPEQLELLEVTGLASVPLMKLRMFHLLMARRWLGDYLSRVTLEYHGGEKHDGAE